MKLERAMLCVEMDCQEVFEANGFCRCPSCGTEIAIPLARILNATPNEPEVESGDRGERHLVLVLEFEPRDVEKWEHGLFVGQLDATTAVAC